MKPDKVLILDIEWRPTKAWVWRPWDETVMPDQIIEDGGILCIGMKWFKKREKFFFSDWQHGKKKMLQGVHDLLSQANAVVTYNGDKYDLPKINGEFLRYNFPPPPQLTSIDLIKSIKKLGYFMNRLAFIGPFLGLGGKTKHEGFDLWTKVIAGDKMAEQRMERYCKRDVALTEKLYDKILPYIKNHPHLGGISNLACGACGSKRLQSRGYRRTKTFRIQRVHCIGCGSWQDGKREKVN
jgi:hypothetical protein